METEQLKSVKEYVENLKSLHLLNSKLESENKKSILTIKVKSESNNNTSCEFKILEKEKVWVKNFNFEDFSNYKSKMGFDGSWKSFFKTIELAVNRTEGGDMSIKYPIEVNTNKTKSIKKNVSNARALPDNLDKEKTQILVLTIFHPLSEDLKVKSDILFEQAHLMGSDEFRNFNFDIALELHESKEQSLNREKEKLQTNSNNINCNKNGSIEVGNDRGDPEYKENKAGLKLELKKNIKRKFISDLINPNIKKRRGKGVKFVEDSQNDEQSD